MKHQGNIWVSILKAGTITWPQLCGVDLQLSKRWDQINIRKEHQTKMQRNKRVAGKSLKLFMVIGWVCRSEIVMAKEAH